MLGGGRTEDQNKKDMCIRLFHLPSSSLPSSIFHLVRFGSCKVWAHMCRNAWRLPGRWKMEDGRLEDGRWKTERAGSLLLFPARLLRYTVDTHSLHVSLRTYVGRDEKKSARTTRLPSSVFHSSVFHLPLSVSLSSTVKPYIHVASVRRTTTAKACICRRGRHARESGTVRGGGTMPRVLRLTVDLC